MCHINSLLNLIKMIDSKNLLILLLSFIIGFCLTILLLDYKNLGFTSTNWLTLYDSKSDFLAAQLHRERWQEQNLVINSMKENNF